MFYNLCELDNLSFLVVFFGFSTETGFHVHHFSTIIDLQEHGTEKKGFSVIHCYMFSKTSNEY